MFYRPGINTTLNLTWWRVTIFVMRQFVTAKAHSSGLRLNAKTMTNFQEI